MLFPNVVPIGSYGSKYYYGTDSLVQLIQNGLHYIGFGFLFTLIREKVNIKYLHIGVRYRPTCPLP